MWQFECSRIFMAIVFIGVAQGLFVVGPKYIRPNQEYKLVITNHNHTHERVNLKVRIVGEADDGQSFLNESIVVLKRTSTAELTFPIPEKLPPGQYKVIIDGMHGFRFHEVAELMHLSKSVSGLIQINKPVFKAGDTVQFRVIVLDTDLKPPAHVKSVQVTIRDAHGNLIRKWSKAKLYNGVFDGDLPISSSPMFGTWSTAVQINEEELVSKTFEVKEYALSSFGLQVIPSIYPPSEEQQGLNFTIVAKNHFGKLIDGSAKVEVYWEEDIYYQNNSIGLYGMSQVQLKFIKRFDVTDEASNVRVKVTFKEQYTNRTETKEIEVTVYKHPYRVELVNSKPQFLPGHAFPCVLKFTYHDGRPAPGIRGKVEEFALAYEITATSDANGLIEFVLRPKEDTDYMEIQFYNNLIDIKIKVEKDETSSNGRHKLALEAPVFANLNEVMKIKVTCNDKMAFVVYYVVSKGNIIASGFRAITCKKKKSYKFDITTTERMMPKTKLVVATVVQKTLVYDYKDIYIGDFHNGFNLSIDENEIKPGRQIVLTVTGRPGSYVGLASYDASLVSYSRNHDLYWEDIERVFEEFHVSDDQDFDKFLVSIKQMR
uniref:TEP1-F n=1 Tax=Anopheles dirus TaxID=7168 RepID=A0A182NP76_9DIPT